MQQTKAEDRIRICFREAKYAAIAHSAGSEVRPTLANPDQASFSTKLPCIFVQFCFISVYEADSAAILLFILLCKANFAILLSFTLLSKANFRIILLLPTFFHLVLYEADFAAILHPFCSIKSNLLGFCPALCYLKQNF